MSYIERPWDWNGFHSLRWQAFLSALTAFMLLGISFVTLGPAQDAIVRIMTTTFHEVGHYVGTLLSGGEVLGLTINADGSGHVSITTTDPLQAIFSAASGMIGVALATGLLIYSGLTRVGVHIVLAALGLMCIILCVLVGNDPTVCLVLLGVGIISVVVAYMPGATFVKSVVVLYVALVLGLGLLGNIEYAYAENIPSFPEPIPSDSQIIANVLDVETRYVGNALVGIIVIIFAITAIFVSTWLHRNSE